MAPPHSSVGVGVNPRVGNLRPRAAHAFSLILIFLGFLFFHLASAQDSTSTNFILRDSIISIEGGRSTSTSFELFGAGGQLSTIESTSTGFTHLGGFLFFPIASSPALSATAGNAQVSLSWTASAATFANITDYEVGTATVSGGPYTFESVGNVLSFVKTGLTNGTAHYFRVRALAGTLLLAQSGETSATPTGGTPTPAPGGGGGVIVPLRVRCDLNDDGRCDIVDFSIMLFYFGKTGVEISRYDLSADGRIDLVDVSVLLYYWV